jgi:hypothetical protein
MQLEDVPARPRAVRARLRAAACLLLTTVAPRLAQAQDAYAPPDTASTPTTQIDVTGLYYGERIQVFEPTLRLTRLYPSGRSFFGQVSIDAITGASPNGTLASGRTQTITSPSGRRTTVSANDIPTTKFGDIRVALDGEWQQPLKIFTFALGAHYSREKDYQSEGVTGRASIDLNRKLTTLTVGGGYNNDQVSPMGGTSMGLSPPGVLSGRESDPKHLTTGLLGVSQVLSRRWLFGVTGSLTSEHGYLTDPYKVLSVIDPSTGVPLSELSEKRPDARMRRSVQADSVYHLTTNILYLSYRRYWDDWGVGSHTVDAKYRLPVGEGRFVEPHVRYYNQTAADFYRFGLIKGDTIPTYATSDYRLAAFQSATLGATFGFTPEGSRREWTVRAEYIGQFGNHFPEGTVGVQSRNDLFPTVNIVSFVVSYRFNR